VLNTSFIRELRLARERIDSYDSYPFSLPVVRTLDQLPLHPKVSFFVGENGSGKSTLLEAIAVALGLNAEGGTNNFSFSTRQSHSVLHSYLRLSKGIKRPQTRYFLRAESYFNFATEIEKLDEEPASSPPIINSYGGKSLHEQSHGESFFALLMNRFSANGLYLLDEPEAALSPQRQLAALARFHDLVNQGSQFIIATHSPILLAYPDAWIYECSSDGLKRVRYEDTEHVQVTRAFLANPERMLRDLLGEDDRDSD
jgi:predicted ATPase